MIENHKHCCVVASFHDFRLHPCRKNALSALVVHEYMDFSKCANSSLKRMLPRYIPFKSGETVVCVKSQSNNGRMVLQLLFLSDNQ